MKVMTVLGTRPEIIKLSRVIPELDKHFKHVLVHTGQNYDPTLNENLFKELGIREPNERLSAAAGLNTAEALGCMLACVDSVLNKHKPDAVLILGDTNSGVAAAYAAKRRKIPLFHMEAGNRCFDDRTPEEINRRIIDHIADINLPYTEHARRNLLAEGVKPDRIIKTGSPMREVLEHYGPEIEFLPARSGEYYVVSCHREENVDDPRRLEAFVNVVNALAARHRVVLSLHPRTHARLRGIGMFDQRVIVSPPFGFFEYIQLQQYAKCVISDSGTLTEEAALLDFPAVMIRQSHERPEGMDAGTAIMADFDQALAAIKMAEEQGPPTMCPDDYFDDDVSKKVARTIQSYTSYINRNVWHKS